MSRAILTTVGTSLKRNSDREGRAMADLLRDDPSRACAETNVLDRLLRLGDQVELLHTDTTDGEACAGAIEAWLRERETPVQRVAIAGFTNAGADLGRGLRSLVRYLADGVSRARRQGDEPVLNALGGYKPQVIYETLVGALFGIPNVYIAEGGDTLQEIPPLPISWDFAVIDEYADILLWLDSDLRQQGEARSRLQRLPGDLRETLTETYADGCITLSALGQSYFEAYRARIASATGEILFSSSAASTYWAMDPTTRFSFDAVLARLRTPEIRRQNSKTLGRDHGDVCVFGRGHTDERVFWYEEEDSVRVLELARHGRDYDRLYKKGVRRTDHDAEDWKPWTPAEPA